MWYCHNVVAISLREAAWGDRARAICTCMSSVHVASNSPTELKHSRYLVYIKLDDICLQCVLWPVCSMHNEPLIKLYERVFISYSYPRWAVSSWPVQWWRLWNHSCCCSSDEHYFCWSILQRMTVYPYILGMLLLAGMVCSAWVSPTLLLGGPVSPARTMLIAIIAAICNSNDRTCNKKTQRPKLLHTP